MIINYVPKEEIYPSFGLCYKDGTIKIREDLSQIAKNFIVVHETYHVTDKETIWWKRELKANWVGLVSHPFGFFIILFMSLAPYRLKYYWERFKKKE